MIVEIGNHLWQSTVVVALAALLTLALRHNGAHVRHAIWVVASLKFLVPFSLLAAAGGAVSAWLPSSASPAALLPPVAVSPEVSGAVDRIVGPFAVDVATPTASSPAGTAGAFVVPVFVAVWAIGFLAVIVMRVRAWQRVRAVVAASTPMAVDAPYPVRSAPGLLEPGVVGFWRPVLLLPSGIERQLTPAQLRAVLEHEVCHIRRRDNLTSALHMVVEAICWFHPAVWWVGARLVDERERACDEHVLRACGEPEAYAEGILNVCKLYVESPLACVSGVSGADLKKRVTAILGGHVGTQLSLVRQTALAMAAVLTLTAPMLAGVEERLQQNAGTGTRFEAVTVKPCDPETTKPTLGAARPGFRSVASPSHALVSPGHAFWGCATVAQLVAQAFSSSTQPLLNTSMTFRREDNDQPPYVKGGPSWVRADGFAIEAKVGVDLTAAFLGTSPSRTLAMPLAPAWADALRAVLEERFKVKVSRDTEPRDVYAITIAPGGLKKDRISASVAGDCQTIEQYAAAAAAAPNLTPEERIAAGNPRLCGRAYTGRRGNGFYTEYTSVSLTQLASMLSGQLDYVMVDRTGTKDLFNFTLEGGAAFQGETRDQMYARQLAELGLKLELVKDKGEYLRIDSVQRLQ